MPKPKKELLEKDENQVEDSGDIKLEESSGLANFNKKPLPSDEEVKSFDEFVDSEIKEEEIEDSLSEIYQDKKGNVVDVSSLDIKKSSFLMRVFGFLVFMAVIVVSAYVLYYKFYFSIDPDKKMVELRIEADENVLLGEEYVYEIFYKNISNVALRDANLEIRYPSDFVLIDSSASINIIDGIDLGVLNKNETGRIKIKGKIIAPLDSTNIILATLRYTPANFSSHFSEEFSHITKVSGLGIDFDYDYVNPILALEESKIDIEIKKPENSFINSFRLVVDPIENLEFLPIKDSEKIKMLRDGVYEILGVQDGDILSLNYKFSDKIKDDDALVLHFEQLGVDDAYEEFLRKELELDVINSNLDLTLISNGSSVGAGVSFGETLNYSINYDNKGEAAMSDLVIMLVLESDFLNWDTVIDEYDAYVKRNTVTWTKKEVPNFVTLDEGESGVIDFSIDVSEFDTVDLEKDYEIKAYVQYMVGSSTEEADTSDTHKSNTVISTINSDLNLSESLRYFDDNNMAVGSGPLPPRVDEETSFVVYWQIENNLHELESLVVKEKLPAYVEWNEKGKKDTGSLYYDKDSREIVWDIGRLPVDENKIKANFSIKIKPEDDDRDRIMVLTSGAEASAVDHKTGVEIKSNTEAKTTKLVDDLVADTSGIVE